MNSVSRSVGTRQWIALILLCAALFLDALDVSIINVALPSIQEELNLSKSGLDWVISGYFIGYAGFLLLGGRTADLLGRRRVFITAMAVFALASSIGGLANTGELLISARILKGTAAAFTAPAALSIITTTFPEGAKRNQALAIYSITGASGFSIGLIIGGLLSNINWRWVFFIDPSIVIVILILTPLFIQKGRRIKTKRNYDVVGATTITMGLLTLVYAVSQANSLGWLSTQFLSFATFSISLLLVFISVEIRSKDPLVPFEIFTSSTLTTANLVALTFLSSFVGMLFTMTVYMQRILNYSPEQTGLAFLPMGLLIAILSYYGGKMVTQFGVKLTTVVGMIFITAGTALLTQISIEGNYFTLILPSFLLIGVGQGLGFPALNIAATAGVSNEDQGLASGLVVTSIQMGAGIGLPIVTAVTTAQTSIAAELSASSINSFQTLLSGYHSGLLMSASFGAIGSIIALLGFKNRNVRINKNSSNRPCYAWCRPNCNVNSPQRNQVL